MRAGSGNRLKGEGERTREGKGGRLVAGKVERVGGWEAERRTGVLPG